MIELISLFNARAANMEPFNAACSGHKSVLFPANAANEALLKLYTAWRVYILYIYTIPSPIPTGIGPGPKISRGANSGTLTEAWHD